MCIDFECTSSHEVADSFEAWIESLLPGEATPLVAWDDNQLYEMIECDTVEFEYPDGSGTEKVEQMLCDGGDQLVLFTRTTSPVRGEELAKVTLPKDIDSTWATIQPFRPEPSGTFTLHLQPKDTDDIGWATSRRGSDGKWKNERARGVPIYCSFESSDRGKLERLRARLFGGQVPKKLLAQEEMQERFETMSEEQQRAAFAQQLLAHVQQLDDVFQKQDLGPVPDELKLAMGNLEAMKKQMMEDLQRRAAGGPADPGFLKSLADSMSDADETVEAPPAEVRQSKQGQDKKGKGRQGQGAGEPFTKRESAGLSPVDEAILSRYEALSAALTDTLAAVVDEPTARAARTRLEVITDEFAALIREVGTRFESEDDHARSVAIHMRMAQAFMRVHEQVYRIQNGVPAAGQHLYDVIQRLFNPTGAVATPSPKVTLSPIAQQIASQEVHDPDSPAAKLVPGLNDLASQLAQGLRAITDEPTALAALPGLDRLAAEYLVRYDQWLAAIRDMENVEVGILHARQALARGEVQAEIARLRAWSRPAYQLLRKLVKRLSDEAMI